MQSAYQINHGRLKDHSFRLFPQMVRLQTNREPQAAMTLA